MPLKPQSPSTEPYGSTFPEELRCLRHRRRAVGIDGGERFGKTGHTVVLLEQHSQLGGLAAYFKRPGGFTFDVSLHGFPVGMIKSCRRYWNATIANSIVQLQHVRFVNPQFQFGTTFDRTDFANKLVNVFKELKRFLSTCAA